MSAVYKRELRSYFTGFTGYVFMAFILFFTGMFAMIINFRSRVPYFEYVLSYMNLVYIIAIPILSMRVIAEDRRQKTDQLLYSLPISMTKVVLGKYFAMITVLLAPVVIMCIYPVFLSIYGSVSLLRSYGAIFAWYLLGCSLLAVGMFMSSLTENQIVAAVMTFAVTLLCYFLTSLASFVPATAAGSFVGFTVLIIAFGFVVWGLTKSRLAGLAAAALLEAILAVVNFINGDLLAGKFQHLLAVVSPFARFANFINGVFDLTAVVYYLTVIALFVFFTVESMEKRRWS